MKNDLIAIADRVDDNETGAFVQRSQKEVELTLQELIDAVKIAQKMEEQEQLDYYIKSRRKELHGVVLDNEDSNMLALTRQRADAVQYRQIATAVYVKRDNRCAEMMETIGSDDIVSGRIVHAIALRVKFNLYVCNLSAIN